ncbi:hypothetical protein BX666DRAFT_1012104 [Dichotomocladium elegans]|nr:hypothetical protein BX666DRAFT_1012104 [Dichotomocladium elegans]
MQPCLERRVHNNEHDLAKLHKQWFQPEADKREKILRHEPILIRRIQRDYDKLQDLASERIELVEGALQLHIRSIDICIGWTMISTKLIDNHLLNQAVV